MDTFAALALATDPPTPSILDRKPEPKSAPLITVTMWKMIIGQSIFQLVVTLVLYFGGTSILSYQSGREQDQLQTLIFNTFVWMQIFNQYNNRRIDNKMNIFEGVQRNYFFVGIQFIIVAGQIMIIFIGGKAFSIHRLNTAQWIYSIVLGFLSIPVAIMIRLVPDEVIRKLIPSRLLKKNAPKLVVSDEERQYEWDPVEDIREQLTLLKKLRGGRLHMIKYSLQHPVETLLPRSRSSSRINSPVRTPTGEQQVSDSQRPPSTPESRSSPSKRLPRSRSNSAFGPATAMAGIVAGSIAGWSPIGSRSQDGFSRSDGRCQLEQQEGLEVHPATNPHDPVLTEPPESRHSPPSQVPELTPAAGPSSLAASQSVC